MNKSFFLIFFLFAFLDHASATQKIEYIDEELQPGEVHLYNISNLKKGDVIKVTATALSGNLDPVLGIIKDNKTIKSFEEYYRLNLPNSLEQGRDFAVLFPSFADNYFLAWNDDYFSSSDSHINYEIEDSGDYQLVIVGTYYNLISLDKYFSTFGKYKLKVELNTDTIDKQGADPDEVRKVQKTFDFHKRVQEITGIIDSEKAIFKYNLDKIDKNEELHIFVETVSGKLRPSVKLRNYGDKLLAFDNLEGKNNFAYLNHKTPIEANDYYLVINGNPMKQKNIKGKFRLLIGVNEPNVKKGKAETSGRPIIKDPIEVEIFVKIDQITHLNQKDENFTVVGNLHLVWVDDKFAYNPDSCKCNEKNYNIKQFEEYIKERGFNWPKFVFLNQQGRRHVQEDIIKIFPDGQVLYFERFTVTLQAPDFNFSKFPFDPQQFYLKLVVLETIQDYVFTVNQEGAEIGKSLGEEEWFIVDYDHKITSLQANNTHSQFNLRIHAQRHKEYYLFRIFIPLSLIIIVSWFIFFMRDFARRVDISVSNLLVFVAFNFTLGSDLPRLGYLTFMDNVIIIAFAVTCLGVVCNVLLRRIEVKGNRELADYLDHYITWGYPALVIVGLLTAYTFYF